MKQLIVIPEDGRLLKNGIDVVDVQVGIPLLHICQHERLVTF